MSKLRARARAICSNSRNYVGHFCTRNAMIRLLNEEEKKCKWNEISIIKKYSCLCVSKYQIIEAITLAPGNMKYRYRRKAYVCRRLNPGCSGGIAWKRDGGNCNHLWAYEERSYGEKAKRNRISCFLYWYEALSVEISARGWLWSGR